MEHYTFYGKDGHSRDGCFKRICYPEWWLGNEERKETKPKAAFTEPGCITSIPGLTNEKYEYFLRHFSKIGNSGKKVNTSKVFMTGKCNNDNCWVIDLGSTNTSHMMLVYLKIKQKTILKHMLLFLMGIPYHLKEKENVLC